MSEDKQRDVSVSPPAEAFDEADSSVMIMSPRVEDALLEHLFALTRPLHVDVLISRETLRKEGEGLRVHLRQLQDINHDVDVRATDEEFSGCVIIDGARFYPISARNGAAESGEEGNGEPTAPEAAGAEKAGASPEELVEAAHSLWERSESIRSRTAGRFEGPR